MSYRRVMIFQKFSRNKLEKKKQNRGNRSNPGLLQQIAGAQCHASHAKPDWTWVEQVRKFEGLDVRFLSLWTYLTQHYKFMYPQCILLFYFSSYSFSFSICAFVFHVQVSIYLYMIEVYVFSLHMLLTVLTICMLTSCGAVHLYFFFFQSFLSLLPFSLLILFLQ